MKKCLLIEVSEDGQVAYGTSEKDDMEPPEGYDMQPAQSLEEAMDMGRQALESNPEQEAQDTASYEEGFKGVNGVSGMEGLA